MVMDAIRGPHSQSRHPLTLELDQQHPVPCTELQRRRGGPHGVIPVVKSEVRAHARSDLLCYLLSGHSRLQTLVQASDFTSVLVSSQKCPGVEDEGSEYANNDGRNGDVESCHFVRPTLNDFEWRSSRSSQWRPRGARTAG